MKPKKLLERARVVLEVHPIVYNLEDKAAKKYRWASSEWWRVWDPLPFEFEGVALC